jgi:Phytanoyl-CoA dioxygenase (PhyH)
MRLFARSRGQAQPADPSGGLAASAASETSAASADLASEGRPDADQEYAGSAAQLREEIIRLHVANRAHPDPATERRLLWLRHLAGISALDSAGGEPEHPAADPSRLPAFAGGLPAVPATQVTPALLRAGILRDGALLVRGLVPGDQARDFADQIERAFRERDRFDEGQTAADGYYEEFTPHARFDPYLGRPWIKMGGGVYAADSPKLSFQTSEILHAAGVVELVSGYLGEPALMSVHKSTLRRADPSVPGAWHQDGAFMGPVRALNLWLALSRCGDVAPGLDVAPVRLDDYVTTKTEEATLEMQVSQKRAEAAAGERGVLRPLFEPGDALLFDELFLHQTGSDPVMRKPRYALECWFFGGSGFPAAYAPMAV